MKRKINELKDRIYEVEGLLELLQLRPDKLRELLPLIRARYEESGMLLDSLEAGSVVVEPEMKPESETVQTEPEVAPVCVQQEPATEQQKYEQTSAESVPGNPRDGRTSGPTFCLNDRFRFRRTIFGGSEAEFNAVMNHLTTLDTYEEAEELFYGDMNLNPEDSDVIDFMTVVKDYFEK